MSSFHAARILSWFCLGLLAIAAGCQARPAADTARSTAAASSAPPPVRVVVRPAERKTLVRKIEVPGQVEAYETAPLMAKVTGYVHRVAVDIGDRVRGPQPADGERPAAEGDLLLELDVPELERELALRKAAVAKARAVVAQSEAAIQLAKAGLASADSEAVEAGFAVEAQAALVAKWKSENDRIVQLAAAAAVTQKVADETGSQLQAAEAAQRQTQAKVQSAQARRERSGGDDPASRSRAGHLAGGSRGRAGRSGTHRNHARLRHAPGPL
jgi:HlyD family secretion protein